MRKPKARGGGWGMRTHMRSLIKTALCRSKIHVYARINGHNGHPYNEIMMPPLGPRAIIDTSRGATERVAQNGAAAVD